MLIVMSSHTPPPQTLICLPYIGICRRILHLSTILEFTELNRKKKLPVGFIMLFQPTQASYRKQGYTLIEVMIVVVIISILASIAYPSYQNSVRKGNRAAAQNDMLDIANRQKQFLIANRSYATKAQLETSGYQLSNDVSSHYDWAITLGTGVAPTYTITFTAKGAQLSDGDMTLNSIGVKTPVAHW